MNAWKAVLPLTGRAVRRLLIVLIAVAWCSRSEATNYGCELFLYSHVNFTYCSNYCRRSDIKMLYYSGLMEALNAHIDRRLQEGALQPKKFEISFSDPMGDMPARPSAPGAPDQPRHRRGPALDLG